MPLYYFAADGSYGEWQAASLLADTSDWTDADWQMIEEATDSERASIAYEIEARRFRERRGEPPF